MILHETMKPDLVGTVATPVDAVIGVGPVKGRRDRPTAVTSSSHRRARLLEVSDQSIYAWRGQEQIAEG